MMTIVARIANGVCNVLSSRRQLLSPNNAINKSMLKRLVVQCQNTHKRGLTKSGLKFRLELPSPIVSTTSFWPVAENR